MMMIDESCFLYFGDTQIFLILFCLLKFLIGPSCALICIPSTFPAISFTKLYIDVVNDSINFQDELSGEVEIKSHLLTVIASEFCPTYFSCLLPLFPSL